MADPSREDPPSCYGQLWDPKAKECTGGMDPAFTNENGSHVREKCIFFNSCGAKLQASRMEPARSLLDPRSIVKNNVPLLSPNRPPQPAQSQSLQFVEKFMNSVAQQQQAIQPYYHQPIQPHVQQAVPPRPIHIPPVQHQQVVQVPMGYQQMMPVNYQMPGYLSVPEVRYQEQSFWSFMGRTVLRSMGKSLGHSVAHLFDTVQLAPPPLPPPPYENGGLQKKD